MRLHVAALPFPTGQGTQAVLRRMLEADAEAGQHAHLLTYGAGERLVDPPFQLHRVPDFPRLPSHRSGPSVRKLALDARMLSTLRKRVAQLRPEVLVAHHVEAAAICLSATSLPVVFFAHTDLAGELPSYTHRALAPSLRLLGQGIDRLLVARAHAVATISPGLTTRLLARHGEATRQALFVPPPWPVASSDRTAPHPDWEAKAKARAGLGLDKSGQGTAWLLYAGNLDAYQGWPDLVASLGVLRAQGLPVNLLVATQSDTGPVWKLARRAGLSGRIRTVPLRNETTRRLAHAAADLAVVPRAVPGGLPIKLLDALARGIPTVASPKATAGLSLADTCQIAHGQDAQALARAISEVLSKPELRRRLAEAGPRYIRKAHHRDAYLHAMRQVTERARRAHRQATQSSGVPDDAPDD
ncbi:MAG: glycosyltransferase family 4 protein [Myxococcales bacterium]|nr:glycosyltransferase family 4 protein [Myxococcales bacterium]MDD9972096.1 glycosyltransferase family 4 protein [Myxococcales bacterium]